MSRGRLILIGVVVTVLALLGPGMAAADNPLYGNGYTLGAQLRGDTEPTGGDPDGFGYAQVTVDPIGGHICYDISVAGINVATASHIHNAGLGAAGPVVVPFDAPGWEGFAGGCVDVDPVLAWDIVLNPWNYYVNVHNADYPAGVVRGQLAWP
jgi:hypothetical protein